MIDLLESLCQWLGEISWKDIATVLSGFSTLAIAFLTILLWNENRLLRKAGSSPRVVAHFEIHPEGTGGINLALSNIGTGPALDISFEIEAEQDNFSKYSIQLDTSRQRAPMILIAQGEKVSFLFGISFNLFKTTAGEEIPLKPFTVTVQWKSVGSKKLDCEKYTLDISQYAGLPGMLSKPPMLKLVDELQGIKKQLAEITSWDHSPVDLIDATKPDQTMRAVLIAKRKIVDLKSEV